MNIQKIELSKLNPAPYNPRKRLKPGDAEYEKLKRSIKEFGVVEPIVFNSATGNIVGGHQRYFVLTDLGETELDCVVVDLDEQREKALNIALNKISGAWDDVKLAELLTDLADGAFDVSLTGFDIAEIDELFGEKGDADVKDDGFDAEKVAEEIVTPVSQRGDVWLLGNHRLMCGDSTSSEDVDVLMDGQRARFVFTDPPWNCNIGADAKHPSWKPRPILNDHMSTDQFGVFLMSVFTQMKRVSVPGCMTYIVMSAQEWGNLMNVLTELGYHWSSTIIWNKDRLVLSRKDYHTKYEPIWYGWLDGAPRLVPLKDRKQSDVWDFQRPSVSPDHPTMKPVELVAKAILNSSRTGDTVLDLFGGSGTTLATAEQTGRICHMMELDPKYCDVILRRFRSLVNSDDSVFLLRDGARIPLAELEGGV